MALPPGLQQHIGRTIARLRNDQSHKSTAESAGITVEKLKQIERGDTMPSMGNLRSIACALGVEPEKFFPDGKIPPGFE